MRLAVLSDIHGHADALHAALKDANAFSPDGYVLCGDLVSGCGEPGRTYRMLRELDAPAVCGNQDLLTLWCHDERFPEQKRGKPVERLARQAYDELGEEGRVWLSALPADRTLQLGSRTIYVTHGIPGNPFTAILSEADEAMLQCGPRESAQREKNAPGEAATVDELRAIAAAVNADVMLCGHSHVAHRRRVGDLLIVNPGVVCGEHPKWVTLPEDIGQYAILTCSKRGVEVLFRAVVIPHSRRR
jgi:predicted phosphodiesterase